MALIILDRSKNTLAEETSHFWLVTSVVDGFRFYYFTKTTAQYDFRGGK
jgi:hypothetical protein